MDEGHPRQFPHDELRAILAEVDPAELDETDLEAFRRAAQAMRRAGASRDGRPLGADLPWLGGELDRRLDSAE